MPYQVFDSGKTADREGHPILKYDCWANSKFDTFEEAYEYACDYMGKCYCDLVPTEPNKVVEYYGKECTIEIREVV